MLKSIIFMLLAGSSVLATAVPEPIPILEEDSVALIDETNTTALATRDEDITIIEVCTIIATSLGAPVAFATVWGVVIAHKMYQLQKQNSCAATHVTTANRGHNPKRDSGSSNSTDTADNSGGNIYALIEPYTNGSNCMSTAQEKTFDNAVVSAGNYLHDKGAHAWCCTYQHGGGTWHAHVKVKTSASMSFDDITCPSNA